MSKKSKRFGRILLAAALLAFPIYAAIAWVSSSKAGISQTENLASFLDHFPRFFQSKESIAWLALLLNITSNTITISTAVGKKTRGGWLSGIILIIGIPMMLWLGLTLL